MVQNRQKVKVNPLLLDEIWPFLGHFQSSFSREVYAQMKLNQAKNASYGLKKLFGVFLKNLKNGPKSSKS